MSHPRAFDHQPETARETIIRREDEKFDHLRQKVSLNVCRHEATINGRTLYEVANEDIWYMEVDGQELPFPYHTSFDDVKAMLESGTFDQWRADRLAAIEEFKKGMSR